jgi:hypothetical protein
MRVSCGLKKKRKCVPLAGSISNGYYYTSTSYFYLFIYFFIIYLFCCVYTAADVNVDAVRKIAIWKRILEIPAFMLVIPLSSYLFYPSSCCYYKDCSSPVCPFLQPSIYPPINMQAESALRSQPGSRGYLLLLSTYQIERR